MVNLLEEMILDDEKTNFLKLNVLRLIKQKGKDWFFEESIDYGDRAISMNTFLKMHVRRDQYNEILDEITID